MEKQHSLLIRMLGASSQAHWPFPSEHVTQVGETCVLYKKRRVVWNAMSTAVLPTLYLP